MDTDKASAHSRPAEVTERIGDDLAFDFDMDGQDVLEQTTNLESRFYTQGYEAGHAHGQLHGLFEGRELGKEKAWELWEEVGYYEGWAAMWVDLLMNKVEEQANGNGSRSGSGSGSGRRGKEARALSHAQTLLDLIKSFPTINPTPTPTPAPISTGTQPPAPRSTFTAEDHTPALAPSESSIEIDLASLISNIRARYRLLCSSLSVRPRLTTAVIVTANPASGANNVVRHQGQEQGDEGVVEGIDGPMKGVDTRQLRF
ncbi:hypothetical protein IAR55_007004 [Kwoniella newhampshirensis]|uniref:Essential protein Yae1 N-terminal domain-containing protein n=1 Tax=Kwoniella newhampshirensis TaxID=1651941 RepID=A0AAW0YCU4_9TREE